LDYIQLIGLFPNMKPYASYFGEMARNNGQPRLSDDQFRRLMNIVYLDGKLAGIDCIRSKLKKVAEDHRFDMDYFKVNSQLNDLTGCLEPGALMDEMIRK